MRALEAKHVGSGGARSRKLPAAAVGELMRRARVGTSPRRVPATGDVRRFSKVQRQCPAADRGGAAIGDRHVNLVRRRLVTGNRGRTRVSGECLTANQQAGHKHS